MVEASTKPSQKKKWKASPQKWPTRPFHQAPPGPIQNDAKEDQITEGIPGFDKPNIASQSGFSINRSGIKGCEIRHRSPLRMC